MHRKTFSFLLKVSFIVVICAIGIVMSVEQPSIYSLFPLSLKNNYTEYELGSASEKLRCGSGFSADVIPFPRPISSKELAEYDRTFRSKSASSITKLKHLIPFSAFVFESPRVSNDGYNVECDPFRIPLTQLSLAEPAYNEKVKLFISAIVANEQTVREAFQELEFAANREPLWIDLCMLPACGALEARGGTERFRITSRNDLDIARRIARGNILAKSMQEISNANFKTVKGDVIDGELTRGIFTAALAIAEKAAEPVSLNGRPLQSAKD